MPEMRRVRLSNNARNQGLTSTYNYENKRYFLDFNTQLNVNEEIANSWISADANVVFVDETTTTGV